MAKAKKKDSGAASAVSEPTQAEAPKIDPDGANYVRRPIEGSTIVGREEQVHKAELEV